LFLVLIGRSPVRISFAGGGTDLPAYYAQYGGAVLSAAINKYFYTVLGKRDDGRIQVISSDLRIFEAWPDIAALNIAGSALEIPVAVLKDIGRNVSIDLFLASEIPPGTGLGSSASVCVNLLKTITTYLHEPLSNYELAERAFSLARFTLRRHVGKQDEYAAAFGGLNFITFLPDGTTNINPVKASPTILEELRQNLMLFFTGASHDSWAILQEQEKSTLNHRGDAVEALHAVRAIAERMWRLLEAGELTGFGRLLDEAWRAKKRVSKAISNARIDQLYGLALENGALGGKITGAGGGGFLLLYCEPQRQESVRKAMAGQGIYEMAFAFDFQGAQVIVNDPFIDSDERGGSRWVFVPHVKHQVA
jgi:D-glycero-alpha-D-manno-heptose-7-phosphate kinase